MQAVAAHQNISLVAVVVQWLLLMCQPQLVKVGPYMLPVLVVAPVVMLTVITQCVELVAVGMVVVELVQDHHRLVISGAVEAVAEVVL